MKLKLITFVVFTIIFSSCTILGSDSDPSKIVGEWEWLYSRGGLFPRTFSPDSAGYSHQQLIYTSKGKFSFYRSDTLAVSGKYSLEKPENEKDLVISYDTDTYFPPQQIVRFKNRDTLILIDRCNDCYIHRYIRTD